MTIATNLISVQSLGFHYLVGCICWHFCCIQWYFCGMWSSYRRNFLLRNQFRSLRFDYLVIWDFRPVGVKR